MKKILIAAAVIAGLCGAAQAAGIAEETLAAVAGTEVANAAPVTDPVAAAQPVREGVFTAQAAWSLGKPAVTAIKRLGVMKAAEKAAILKCRTQGLSGCVAVSSRITAWDHFVLTAEASAVSMVPVKKGVFAADVRWTVPGRGFNDLERLGVLKDAEEAAIYKCKSAGHQSCFSTDSDIISCDKYSCTATAVAMPFAAGQERP